MTRAEKIEHRKCLESFADRGRMNPEQRSLGFTVARRPSLIASNNSSSWIECPCRLRVAGRRNSCERTSEGACEGVWNSDERIQPIGLNRW